MAGFPICCKMSYKDQYFHAVHESNGCLSPVSSDGGRRWLNDASCTRLKEKTRSAAGFPEGLRYKGEILSFRTVKETSCQPTVHKAICCLRFSNGSYSHGEEQCKVWHAFEFSSNKQQLQSLDNYFGRLQEDANIPSSDSFIEKTELDDQSNRLKAKTVLESLDDYLGKVNEDANPLDNLSSASDAERPSNYLNRAFGRSVRNQLKSYGNLKNSDLQGGLKNAYDEASDLYLISILTSINIAVFLFEIASPIQNSDSELFSLPSVYGAKINHLILIGEWWRLVTPMFLHSGILHIALSCWMLLNFGPRVCRVYGSFTFFLIYVLGGISGNLTSFLQTPEPTVGGTGPVFAIIGAWLIYNIQNKDVTLKDDVENMFQKAIIATAFSFILSNSGPIDNWTHFGAAFTGIVYGFLTCPMLQMDNTSTKTSQKEGIALVRRSADPCKSLAVFCLFMMVLSSLLFVVEPPLR